MSILMTRAELQGVVSGLRAMAAVEPAQEVGDALNRLADRYVTPSSRNRTITSQTRPIH
jgi:hypothetical protein